MIAQITAMLENCLAMDYCILDWIQAHCVCPFMDAAMPIITLFGEEGIFWIALALLFLLFKKTRKMGWSMAIALVMGVLVCNVWLKPAIARCRPFADAMSVGGGTVSAIIAKVKALFGVTTEETKREVAGYFASYHTNMTAEARDAFVQAIKDSWKVNLFGFQFALKEVKDFSFPSGHTIASFEACTAMLMCRKKLGVGGTIMGVFATILAVLIAFSRLYLYIHYPTDVLTAIVFGILFGIIASLIVSLIYHFLPDDDLPREKRSSGKKRSGGRFLAK